MSRELIKCPQCSNIFGVERECSKPARREEAMKDPFEFFDSPWWKDATKQLCTDGWPTFVVPLNCMVRDAKSAYDALGKEFAKYRREEMGPMTARLIAFEQEIEKLKAENAELRREVDTRARPTVEKLRAENERLRERIKDLEDGHE